LQTQPDCTVHSHIVQLSIANTARLYSI